MQEDHRTTTASAATGVEHADQAHDARGAALASLAAGRSPWLWWTCAGIALSVVLTWVADVQVGGLTLALLLVILAVSRGALRTSPSSLVVRSRTHDVAVLVVLAVGVGVLSQTVPLV
ncbi:DUF3017 domain-containing protein [Cellulomonas fimi]|uniref:DUF3017 domain-containing protein n=1 Tax=Cellulomonas fimi TaxID=1708 RepID=A0A7Y0LW02_CELFI|nr:DUF3017 domain-containing protein [Cellulomonas fimi]NMR18980.1 DUF3017 domain-containing protein [Cellulomonas fimi]